MGRRKQIVFGSLAVLAILAAGCAKQAPPPVLPVYDGQLVELNLTVAGGPLSALGAVERGDASIVVRDSVGEAVRFNDEFIAEEDGEHTRLGLAAGESMLPIYLFSGGTYQFDVRTHDSDGVLLAHGTAERTTVNSGSNATFVQLSALMGLATLHPRLPVRQLLPGQELDLVLGVAADKRPDLRVSGTDFTAEYEVENGTSVTYSDRGIRVRVGDRTGGDLVVRAITDGLVNNAGTPASGSVRATVRIPFATDIIVDLEEPSVSMLAFDAEQQIFTGIADDDFGIASLDIYDGPNQLATSDPDVAASRGLPVVVFPGGGTAFVTELALPAGTYDLTAVAADTSGNDKELSLTVTVP